MNRIQGQVFLQLSPNCPTFSATLDDQEKVNVSRCAFIPQDRAEQIPLTISVYFSDVQAYCWKVD